MNDPRHQVIFPTLRYRDPAAAIAWLESTLGFRTHAVHEEEGIVAHAQLAFRGDLVMLGPAPSDPEAPTAGPSWTYLVDPDVDARYDHAVAAGAEVVHPIADQDYGSREFTVRDPEGSVWSFGTYDPMAT